MKVKSESEVAQSCPTLRNARDCSLPGSSVHGIFQARVLEWGAITYFCFIDYAKAFDSVDHNKMWKILQEIRIPDNLEFEVKWALGEGNGTPLQHSCLENPMDRGAW